MEVKGEERDKSKKERATEPHDKDIVIDHSVVVSLCLLSMSMFATYLLMCLFLFKALAHTLVSAVQLKRVLVYVICLVSLVVCLSIFLSLLSLTVSLVSLSTHIK